MAAATAITMTGPTSGPLNAPSSVFTVGANGDITGTVVVTPSAGGGGGTFTPSTVSINTATPTATFVYTPASGGAKTISSTNNGGLSNPSNITFTPFGVNLTLTVPAVPLVVGRQSESFTVTVDTAPAAATVVTPSDRGLGGTFSPATLTLQSGTLSGTFTYTPGRSGAVQLVMQNNGGLTTAATGVPVGGPVRSDGLFGRLRKFLASAFTNRDMLALRGTTAAGVTAQEIFVLGDATNSARIAIADGETQLLSLKTIGRSASNTVSTESTVYSVTRNGATVTVAAVGSAGTVTVPSAGTGATVVTVNPPDSGTLAWTWVVEVTVLSTVAR